MSIFKKISEKNGILLVILISLICLYVYREFIVLSKLYIYVDWGWDTYGSYWAWYAYLTDWAQNGFPMWNFRIGIGASVFSVANLLFDPFNILYIVVSKEFLGYTFGIVFIIKIILSGSFFYLYLNSMGFARKTSLIVSLLYAFNGYLILWGQHYWFANIILYAPLVLYSLESLIQRSKWILFSLMIGLTAIYSYYFLYMISIYLVLYVIARYIVVNNFNTKKFIKFLMTFGLSYLLGVGLGAIVFIPSVYTVLTNPRAGGAFNFSLNPASLIEYVSILGRPFSNEILGANHQFVGYSNYYESPQLYCGLLTLLLLPQLFKILKLKEKIVYGILGGVLICSILIPYGSVLFNAFSAFTYRWSFILILFELMLLAYATDHLFKDGSHVDQGILKRTFSALGKVLAVLLVFVVLYKSLKGNITINSVEIFQDIVYTSLKPFVLITFFLCSYYLATLLYSKNVFSSKMYINLSVVIVCLELALFSNITVNERDTLDASYITTRQGYFDNTNEALNHIRNEDQSFYRVEKSYYSASQSDPLFQNFYGTTVYNSLNNPSYLSFLKAIDASNVKTGTMVDGFKDRLVIQTLLGVKYYIGRSLEDKPYGYSFLSEFGDVFLFRNDYYLPVGFSYGSYITEEDFSKLSVEEKDIILLKYAVLNDSMLPESYKDLDKYDHEINKPVISMSNVNLDFSQITFGGNMEVIGQHDKSILKYKALDNDPMIFIPFNELIRESKIKITFQITSTVQTTGQVFYTMSPNDFTEERSQKFSISPGSFIYEVDTDFINADQIRLDIGEQPGEYTIQDIHVRYTPASEYVDAVENLRKETFQVEFTSDDHIKGNIKVSKDKLLLLTIPYSKGWQVYVDDIKQPLVVAQAGLSGVFLQKGEHKVEVKYKQPGLTIGGVITGLSLVVLIVLLYRQRKRK